MLLKHLLEKSQSRYAELLENLTDCISIEVLEGNYDNKQNIIELLKYKPKAKL